MNKLGFNPLFNFISPVTGKVTLPKDYILVGDSNGYSQKSPALIDLKLDVLNLKNLPFILKHTTEFTPNAQGLDVLKEGFLYNIGGVLETRSGSALLPPLTQNKLWIGDSNNVATETQNIGISNLPSLTSGKVWQGDTNNRPVEVQLNNAPADATYILQTTNNNLPNAQALNLLIGGGILKTTAISNGVISIASGGNVPGVNDYVRPIDLEALQTQVTTLEGEVTTIQGQVTALEGTVASLSLTVTGLGVTVGDLGLTVAAHTIAIAAIPVTIAGAIAATTFVESITAGPGITVKDNSTFGIHKEIVVSITTDPIIPGIGGMVIPAGDSSVRTPSPSVGTIRFNTDL